MLLILGMPFMKNPLMQTEPYRCKGKPLRQLHGDLKNGGDVWIRILMILKSYGVEIYLRAPQDGTTGFPDEIASFYRIAAESVSVTEFPAVIGWIMRTCGSGLALFVFLVWYRQAAVGREPSGRNTEDGFRWI